MDSDTDAPSTATRSRSRPRRGWQRYDAAAVEDLLKRRWSPMLMRWLLASRLIDARQAAGLNQRQACKALGTGWGMSKLNYIEPAERPVATEADLQRLIDVYRPHRDEAELWQRLWGLSRQEEWWDDPGLGLTREAKRVLGLEWGAHRLWVWIPSVVHVFAQTEAYLRARIVRDDPTRGERAQAVTIEVGRNRRRVIEGADAGEAELIVDEAALYRQVGGPDVLGDQLGQLRKLVTDSPVTLRVLPYTVGYSASMRVGFTSLGFQPAATSPDVVHAEPLPGAVARVVRDDADLDHYERTFNELRSLCADKDGTLDALDRAQQALEGR